MNDLVYDVLKNYGEELGKLVCKDLGIEFYGIEILHYEYNKEFCISVEAIKEGRQIAFEVTEDRYGKLVY